MADTTGSLYIAAPRPVITITVAGTGGTLLISAPKPEMLLTTGLSNSGNLSLRAPVPTLGINVGRTHGRLRATAPAPSLTVQTTRTNGSMAITAPVARVAALSTYTMGTMAALRSPSPAISVRSTYTVGSLIVSAPKPRILVSGLRGSSGSLAIVAPVPVVFVSGFTSTSGSLNLLTPAPQISVTEMWSGFPCLVLNMDTMLLSEYSNYDFIGFAKLGSELLGLCRDGNIYVLGGDTDNGTEIDAVFETGLDDQGSGRNKKLCGLVAGIRSSGETRYRARRDEEYGDYFTIESSKERRIETRRIDAEKTKHSRAFGIEFSNIDGAYFSVDSLELLIGDSVRRSGG